MAKYFENNSDWHTTFDFTGKKVKKMSRLTDGTPYNGRFFAQDKWKMASDIDVMNRNRNMLICYDHFKYEEIAEILLHELEKACFDNVTIIK